MYYEAGHTQWKPNNKAYSSVIDAWAKSSADDARERAEQIFRRMIDLSDNGQDVDARPNNSTFNAVINAWAKSKDGGALGTERVLRTMEHAA